MTETSRDEIKARLVTLGRSREALRRKREAVDAELRDAAREANAAGFTWVQINDAAKIGSSPQAAQMFAERDYEPRKRPKEWLTLTAAAKTLGMGHVTLKARLADPDDSIHERVTVIPPEQAGFKSPRYIVADE